MAWEKLVVSDAEEFASGSGITVSITPANARRVRRFTVSVNAQKSSAAWWQHGVRVDVAHGAGEHEGKLRVEPTLEGAFTLAKPDRQTKQKPERQLVSLKIPAPRWIDSDQHFSRAVSFTVGSSWLEITLPEWARRRQADDQVSENVEPSEAAAGDEFPVSDLASEGSAASSFVANETDKGEPDIATRNRRPPTATAARNGRSRVVSNTQPRKIVEQIGARIKAARLASGLSFRQIARAMNLSHHESICSWERGDSCPNAVNIVRLCGVLGVSADWLLGIRD